MIISILLSLAVQSATAQIGNEVTITVRKDSTEIEVPTPPLQFYLVETYEKQSKKIRFKSKGGAEPINEVKWANVLYANDANIIVTGFDLKYKLSKGKTDSLHSNNHWLTPEMVKVMKKLKKNDAFTIQNIQYRNYKGEVISALPLEFRVTKRNNRLLMTKGSQVVTNGGL